MPIQKCQGKLNLNAEGYESKVRGSPMFPCGAYYSDMTDPTMSEIPWHWHEEIEVLAVRAGVAQLYVNGERYSLREGEGAFINSNVLHSAWAADEMGCMLNSLVFDASLLSGAMESVFEQRYVRPLLHCHALPVVPFYRDAEWTCEAAQCVRGAYKACNDEEYGYELVVRGRLTQMWHLLVTNMRPVMKQASISENRDAVRIKMMMRHLHRHYAEKISLRQIAAAANISERECLRCFKKTIGMPPMQYLLKYRVSISARLLADTALTVTEICTQAGFENASHFSKTFKYFMSCTPTVYRKRARTT